MGEYIKQAKLIRFSLEDKKILNQLVTTQEITDAITKQNLGETSGPDSLTARYYRSFEHQLSPYLQQIFNQILIEGTIPHHGKKLT